ncbi:MAG: hypothetical protein F4092_14920 [Rhodospirillaceae bacterium]|nr:hypothetical protein [Rhodospirillaceae bacterium]
MRSALNFHLYGITDRDDVRYVYSTFPIFERQEMKAYGHAWMNALEAGYPDAEIAGQEMPHNGSAIRRAQADVPG